jgi:hypothetical protein
LTTELIREATRDGQRVVRLRCYDGQNGNSLVEAEVTPLGGGETVKRGPYRFATAHEAFRFIQEAVLTLQYLGCAVG